MAKTAAKKTTASKAAPATTKAAAPAAPHASTETLHFSAGAHPEAAPRPVAGQRAPSAGPGEFPKMLYGPKGTQVEVKDPDAQRDQEKKGFVEHPDDVVEPTKKKGAKDAAADVDDE